MVIFCYKSWQVTSDGDGGTVKRITSQASLQRPFDRQIISAIDMFKFCNEELKGIKFEFRSKETMEVTRENLKTRFLEAKAVPGTRSYHHFVPLSSSCIGTKRTLTDEEYASKFDFALDIEQICPWASKTSWQLELSLDVLMNKLPIKEKNVSWVGQKCLNFDQVSF